MTRQNILIVVLILALAGVGYFFFMGSEQNTPTVAETSNNVEVQFQERLTQLRRLKTLQFDTSVLRDPFFGSLATQGILIQPSSEVTGRTNPFLPF